MLLRGSLLAILGQANNPAENDIIFTPTQIEKLKQNGYNVDGLHVMVSSSTNLVLLSSSKLAGFECILII